jgi:hypothetical protein
MRRPARSIDKRDAGDYNHSLPLEPQRITYCRHRNGTDLATRAPEYAKTALTGTVACAGAWQMRRINRRA